MLPGGFGSLTSFDLLFLLDFFISLTTFHRAYYGW